MTTAADDDLSPEEQAEVEEWGRTLDELDARAVAAEESGDPRVIAPAVRALAEHVAGTVDSETLIDLLLTARDAYLEFDGDSATEMIQAAGFFAQADGDYHTAREAFLIACEELSERDDPEKFAGALNDFGAMATQVGEYEDADDALSTSIQIYLDLGAPDDAAEVRVNRANTHRLSGRADAAERELISLEEYFGPDSLHGAMCQQSLAGLYAETGRNHLARPLFERSIAVCERHDDDEHAAEGRMGLAWILVALGEGRRGDEMLAAASRQFAEQGRPDKVAVCEYNRANAAVYRADFAAADVAFDAAAKGLAAAGLHHQMSKLQWNRVKRLTMEAAQNPERREELTAEAVDAAVVSLIAADYERFQFPDPARRIEWRDAMEHRITWTFLLAFKMGSPTLTADLIETVLNAGVYGISGAAETDLGAPEPLDVGPAPRSTAFAPGNDQSATALTLGAAATLLSTTELPMAPPPALIDGSGRVLLERHRDLVSLLVPDLAETLDSAPRVFIF